eukprot:CAMPEP_0197625796 /NCGR_PEP_ID=MMETSP1338-20131121/5055_1 /TAXON_ID=43686 ORGANISM="Pelagodinium beii, Strain RCC1491" /NCGR_SAMPLE_ID=MMETSP1338 /ASSEMBLY_ACC=CAM_ASM_000754 /LENGTH=586 /DNA_ID=CAMNT_0043196287 /DNA_START=39 /DNA_END=1799 /DNA_ORIENTATION=-
MASLATEIDRLIDELYVEKSGGTHPLRLLQKEMTNMHQLLLQNSESIASLIVKQKEAQHHMEAETVQILMENKQLRMKVAALEAGKSDADPEAGKVALPGAVGVGVSNNGPDRAAGNPNANKEQEEGGEQGLTSVLPKPAESAPASSSLKGLRAVAPEDDEAEGGSRIKTSIMFADADSLKHKLRENMYVKEYDVRDFYKDKGFAQWLAKNQIWEYVTLFIIAINSLWMAIETDYNDADSLLTAEAVFIVVENLFCVFFTFEIVIRFGAFKHKPDCLKDGWFVFDSLLVTLMIVETWIFTIILAAMPPNSSFFSPSSLRVLRLFRLTRMARMVRLMRAFPELIVMVKAMMIAFRSVAVALGLLMFIVYVFAIAFTQLLDGKNGQPGDPGYDNFRNVLMSVNTLLLDGAFPDQKDLINSMGSKHAVYYLLMLVYMLVAGLTVMNMIVGILCELISVISAVEKETMLLSSVRTSLQNIMEETKADADGSGMISKREFDDLVSHPSWGRILSEVDVDVVALVDLSDFIFEDDRELSFADFMDLILQLRGTNQATVKDIVDLRKLLKNQSDKMDKMFNDVKFTQPHALKI